MSHTLLLRARTIVTTLGAVAALSFAQISHAAFSQIVSFGDSLSDAGNVFAATGGATPTAPYVAGKFSNGDVWLDYLAADLGVAAPTASAFGGTNFAWGGSRTSLAGSIGQPSAQVQVGQYLTATGGVADPNALYTILIGGNDINAFDGVGYGAAELAADGQLVATLAGDLLAAGAQSILVLNVPDLGAAPIADGNEAGATSLTSLYNGNLAAALAGLGSPNVALLDTFTISQNIVANPAAFGLTNVDDACLDTSVPSLCGDPENYLFWDDLHPTTVGHELIADAALVVANNLAPVPLPAALPMMMFALSGLIGVRKLRA